VAFGVLAGFLAAFLMVSGITRNPYVGKRMNVSVFDSLWIRQLNTYSRGLDTYLAGLDSVFDSGAVESQKNLRVDILDCWLDIQHG
jgi:hypothetical protein